MYNSDITIGNDGRITASTSYNGQVAIYLKNNNQFIEKELYSIKDSYTFSVKPNKGVVSALFFFKDKQGEIVKYYTDDYIYNDDNTSLKKLEFDIVVDEVDFRITHYNQGSDITFVTFNGTKTTKDTVPFGLAFIIKNGWNLVSVAQDNDTQYQMLSLETFFKYVNPIVSQKKVYAYGVSLGGYCALYYGGCINATIIAGSPKNSAHPLFNLDRFKNLNFLHKSFDKIPLTLRKVYIAYDPKINADANFISNVVSVGYPNPEYLPIENGTHMILQTLLKANVLKLYIFSIINNKYDGRVARYITAKCKYLQGNKDEAFNLIDELLYKEL